MVPGYSIGVWECNLAGIKHQKQQPQPQYAWKRENCNVMEAMVGLLKDSVLSSFWHVVSMWWRGINKDLLDIKDLDFPLYTAWLCVTKNSIQVTSNTDLGSILPTYQFPMILDPVCTMCIDNFHFHLSPLIYILPAFQISQKPSSATPLIISICGKVNFSQLRVHWQWVVVERPQTLAFYH